MLDRTSCMMLFSAMFYMAAASAAPDSTSLSHEEEVAIADELSVFYGSPRDDRRPLQAPTPKFDVRSGTRVFPNSFLRLSESSFSNPLLSQAQAKGTTAFQRAYCAEVKSHAFPSLRCETSTERWWATAEKHDNVDDLVDTWIPAADLTRSMDKLPASGQIAGTLWSDNYWRVQYGGTSYRYSNGRAFSSYSEAVSSYAQPSEWLGLLGALSGLELSRQMATWSPAEKYDATVGDLSFSLTNQQKNKGRALVGENGDVASWMGICHGWSAAAIMAPAALSEVAAVGPQGTSIAWYPSDLRALTSLSWSVGDKEMNFIGGRCNVKNPSTYPNGRLVQSECFDNNPATFHLALANMVGRYRQSFIMDKTFDYEVWNQPVHSYRFHFFNPLNPRLSSSQWRAVAVDYDARFKEHDRFQTPLTRGTQVNGQYDDSRVKKIVGVVATVVYADGITPPHGPQAGADALTRASYTYDLELELKDGAWTPTGGEWHKNAHPDFLWVPRRGSVAAHAADATAGSYSPLTPPNTDITVSAQKASVDGYPLCRVIQALVTKSSGATGFRCQGDPVSPPPVVVTPPAPPVTPPCAEPDGPATLVFYSAWPSAQFWLDGRSMGDFSRSTTRTLKSPPLRGCHKFSYELKVYSPVLEGLNYYWRTQSIRVEVRANTQVQIRLDERGALHVSEGGRS